jgi:hypothetical protein
MNAIQKSSITSSGYKKAEDHDNLIIVSFEKQTKSSGESEF